ncbi:echinoidin-like [Acanthaster planci]|uniref:Echinoidin-like n=1 Tax=Acanthaster planci TaxID=133434 RepID=A0A8B8A199_ACAPL|nr:echinoidin-like [Acanthaster planci]
MRCVRSTMKLLPLLCFLVYVGSSTGHIYEPCPSGWMSYGSSCYRYFGQRTNQITAENICRQFSGCSGGIGHLVSTNTREENDFIFNYVRSIRPNAQVQLWLGARRIRQTSRWLWSDGTEITPNSFNAFPGQSLPQEQGRNCMGFVEASMPEWRHVNCGTQGPSLPFMCELKSNAPDPATCPSFTPGGANPRAPGPVQAPVPIRFNKAGNIEQRRTGRP